VRARPPPGPASPHQPPSLTTDDAPSSAPYARVPVVAIAASVGGVRALGRVLAALPPAFPAAVLVVQHLERRRPSRLAEVLSAVSPLPVAFAVHGEAFRAGRVYLAPPDHHLLVCADGTLALSEAAPEHYCRPSADPLFTSAARACGPGAVAVVLTGRGGDGSAGVVEVRRLGGTVVAQDAASAEAPGMPASAVATGAVDHVVPLDGIAPLLARLLPTEVTS
jgi:two-component system, chemotaxis family, protein-glutamate methylesterase/glutaminase